MSLFANVIEAWRVARADRLFPKPWHAPPVIVDGDALAVRALEVAISQIGRGEEGGNNRGPDVEKYIHPARPPQNWCGGFASWCYEAAAGELGAPLPFARSLGAKRLGANVAAVGRRFTDPTEARPGDLMVFHRGAHGSWMGHVAMVDDAVIDGPCVPTIEGNAGPKVKRWVRSVDRDRFAWFASLRRG